MKGKTLGDYVVSHEIARGGQGLVLAAAHVQTQRPVALKLLTQATASGAKRFRQEAKILSALAHPNVLRVFDLFEWQGLPCMALERVEGESLAELTSRQGALTAERAAALLLPICDALALCHRHGVVHRDLKPANVVLEHERDRPVLLDFGIAQRDAALLPAASLDATRLSVTGEIKGSPCFMAPEQAAPERFGETGPATDVYGVGGLLLSLLTQEVPTRAEGPPVAMLLRVVNEPAPDLGKLLPGAPRGLVELCRRCLAKPPSQRPSLAEVAIELARSCERPAPAFARPALAPEAKAPETRAASQVAGKALGSRDPTRVGPYRLERRLGAGGMGAVYLGRHHTLDTPRAIKVVDSLVGNEARSTRFRREVEILARVRHPNVVGVHEGGQEGRWLWFAMDWVQGASLEQLLAERRPTLDEALSLAHGCAAGVAALHRLGVIHRDLKPANLVVRDDGTPVVIDLGLALAPEQDQRLTRTGALVGTPRYMSPELLHGSVSPTVDVYALGLILFELVTGQVATGDVTTPAELIVKILHERPPPPSTIDPTIPSHVDALCARLLAKESSDRPEDAGAVEALLAQHLTSPGGLRSGSSASGWGLAAIAVGLAVTALVFQLGGAGDGGAAVSGPAPAMSTPTPVASIDPEDAQRALDQLVALGDLQKRARGLARWIEQNPRHAAVSAARSAWRSAQRTFPLRTLYPTADVQEAHVLPRDRLLVCSGLEVFLLDAARERVRGWTLPRWAHACVSPDRSEALLWSTAKAASLQRVNLDTGELVAEIPTGYDKLESIAWAPSGDSLALGGLLASGERSVAVRSLSGGPLQALGRVWGTPRQLTYGPAGLLLCGGGRQSKEAAIDPQGGNEFDNVTRIYSLSERRELVSLQSMAAIDALTVLNDGTLLTGSQMGEVKRYSLPEGEPLSTFVSRQASGKPEFGNGLLALALPGAIRGMLQLGETIYLAEGEINAGTGSLSAWTLKGERLRFVAFQGAVRDMTTDGELLYLSTQRGLQVWLP